MLSAPSPAAGFVRRLAAATDPRRLRLVASNMLATTGAYVVALGLALTAATFALISAHAGLGLVLPAWAAALVMSGALLVLALVAWIIARRRSRAIVPRPSAEETAQVDGDTVGADAAAALATAQVLAPLVDAALSATRERPGEAMLTALAAGFIVASLRRRPDR